MEPWRDSSNEQLGWLMRMTRLAVLDIIPPEEALERIKADCGVQIEYYNGDFINKQEVTQIIETFHRLCGSVDMSRPQPR